MINVGDVLFWGVRHGRTDSNDLKIYRGWSNADVAQLDNKGRGDAKAAARFLKSQNAPVEIILADTLDRTMETAEILAAEFGARIVGVRGLHPLHVGEWEGTPKADHPPEQLWDNPAFAPPGGESLNEFNPRQFKTFKSIFEMVDTVPRGSVVVVWHGSNVSFLHNNVFKEKPEIGYEGLVEPGGVLAVTTSEMVPLLRQRGAQPTEEGGDGRESAESAEYMELEGAVKDAECRKVEVEGGVSRELGCCDRYQPESKDTSKFKCGVCEYLEAK